MDGSPLNGSRRPWGCLGVIAAVALVVLGVFAFGAFERLRGPSEVTNADVEFAAGDSGTTAIRAPRNARDTYDDGANWPMYGGGADRVRYQPVPAGTRLRPPLAEPWGDTGRVLLEFPPVLCGSKLYLLRGDGRLRAVDRRTGEILWQRRPGFAAASSPACGGGRVIVTVLKRAKRIRAGQIAAYSTGGRPLWRRVLASRTESSPLLAGDRVVFGTEKGDVLALRAATGGSVWRYRAGGAVKAAVTRDGGTLFVGDYGGWMNAIRLSNGRRVWRTKLGGTIYSTASAAYGRIYVGSTNRSVSALGQRTGRIAWRRRADGYVYSAPAVAPGPGGRPTVYVGSYGGTLYAFDARSGTKRWSKDLGGKISGGVTVVGDVVLYANLGKKNIGGRGASTGAPVLSFRSGAFDPGISDGRRLYLLSYTSLYHLVPRAQAAVDARSLAAARQRDARAAGRRSGSS